MNAITTTDFDAFSRATAAARSPAVARHTQLNRLHPAVFGLTIATYVAMVAAFAIGFAGPVELSIAFAIVGVVAAASVGLPWVMARSGADFWQSHGEPDEHANSFRAFLNGSFETASGKVSGRGALALVITVPVCLTLGVIAMAIIARLV